jgi:hypothetical protein
MAKDDDEMGDPAASPLCGDDTVTWELNGNHILPFAKEFSPHLNVQHSAARGTVVHAGSDYPIIEKMGDGAFSSGSLEECHYEEVDKAGAYAL